MFVASGPGGTLRFAMSDVSALNDAPSVADRPDLSDLVNLFDEKSLAEFVTSQRTAWFARWESERGGRFWMHEHAVLLDAVLRRVWTLGLERSHASGTGIAVVATGGYGQRLLAPYSDLDVTFLAARDDDSPLLRVLFGLLMGTFHGSAKMKVGYAYRTLADIDSGGLDHQTQTALLDARLIAGDTAVFHRFERLFEERLQAADFLFRKEDESRRRRERWGNSPFVTEPNVKEGMGCLRDLQTAAWMARVRFGANDGLWRDLVRRKVITKEDLRRVTDAREFVLTTRCALHLSAGERRETLALPRQNDVAERMGFQPSEDAPPAEPFLARWYESAACIAHVSDKVIARCLEAPIALGQESGLSSVRRRVSVTDPQKTTPNPHWPFDALDFCQEHGLELALATEEAFERWNEEPKTEDVTREAGRRFLSLLARPGDVGATLRRMRSTGVLDWLLPELAACMRLVPYDPSHTLTVGEHSLRVLDNLIALRDGPQGASGGYKAYGRGPVPPDDRLSGYRAALAALDNPLSLYLAALLHDIGKQWPRDLRGHKRGHSETGAERIPRIGKRLGALPGIVETTEFLVRRHLLLAETSRLRDLGQPSTIQEVARTVGDGERLRMLYLLTWADTSAVGPGVLSEMNTRLLEELFLRTEAYLSRDVSAPPDAQMRAGGTEARLASVRQRLQRQFARERTLQGGSVEPEAMREHIEAMPAAYLLNTAPDKMSLHLAMMARLREGVPVAVDMRSTGLEAEETEVTVVTRDDPRPGLFAKLTGALVACDANLHAAQAFTREQDGERIAIDTLRVDYKGRALGPEKRVAVEEAIRQVLGGEKTVPELIAQRRRPFDPVQRVRSVHVEAAAPDSDYTLVDVEAPDEGGVVYRLATLFTFLGWNIHAARISAWGGNARCAFYVTGANGERLMVQAAQEQLRRRLS